MPVLSARDLSKSYGPQTLFAGVSLTIEEGERVGLLGANGAGKSTLLRVLAGLEPPDAGILERQRGASVAYLKQEPAFAKERTPRELALEGLTEWSQAHARHAEVTARLAGGASEHALVEEQAQLAERIERLGGWGQGHRAADMLHRLGIADPDRPIASMSGGEQRRIALAQILVAEPSLAILDEPTNHLDVDTIEYLEDYLAERFRGAVLLVTHDRYVLDAIADRILELEFGVLTEYQGGYSEYLEQKAERLAQQERVEQNRLNQLRRERAWLLRGPKARTTKQKARVQRAQALLAVEAPAVAGRVDLGGLEAGASQTGKTILELDHVRVAIGARTLISDLTLHMTQGERMGIVGPNGAGKTTLLKLVSGELEPASGKVKLGTRTEIAYFDQARAGLQDTWSVYDNVAGREHAQRQSGDHVQIGDLTMELRTYLERFLFRGDKQRQPVGSLSGGERARVALAKALRGGCNMLLLDEPTNDLDVSMLGELEELLVAWPGCALIVSHDRAFLSRVATSILAFEGEGRVVRYAGNYDAYRAQRANAQPSVAPPRVQERGSSASAAQPSAPEPSKPATAKLKPLTYAERIELSGMLDAIAAAEEELAKLEAALSSAETYTQGPDAARQAQAEYERRRDEVARLMARWEELETRSAAGK